MTRYHAVLAARWLLGMSSIGFVGLSVLPVLYPRDALTGVPWILFVVFAVLATTSVISIIVTDPLLFLLRQGFRGMFPTGKEALGAAEAAVRRSKRTIKVLDTYWRDANHFRDAIQQALLASPTCEVQILLAKRDGCVARIRDVAMLGEAPVEASLPGTMADIKGMREQVNRASEGAGRRIKVRFYDAIVMGPMVIVDDARAIVGTYLQSGGSTVTPAFDFKKPRLRASSTVPHFVMTFDRLWRLAGTDTDF